VTQHPSLCPRCGAKAVGESCRRCDRPVDAVSWRALGPYDRKAGLGCATTAALILSGAIGVLVASRAWGTSLATAVALLCVVVAIGCALTIVAGLDMAFARRWEYSSSDGTLHGQAERMLWLRGGMGVILSPEARVPLAPRQTSSIRAAEAGFENVVAALESRGRVFTQTSDAQVCAFVVRVLAAVTGMSARGEIETTVEEEKVWRKGYARRPVVGEQRPRTVIARTGSELPTGDLECLIHAVLTGKEALHRVARGATIAVYREAHPRSEMRLALVGILQEIDRQRLIPRSTDTRRELADDVAAAIDDHLRASPQLAAVLWDEVVQHGRDRFED